jgi:hypothetical protein
MMRTFTQRRGWVSLHRTRGPETETNVQILVNQKPIENFTAKQEKQLRLTRELASVSGSILSAEEASAAFRRRMNWQYGALAVVALAAIAGLALAADALDAPLIYLSAAVILILLMGVLFYAYRRRMTAWDRDLAPRVHAVAAAGSAVEMTDLGLAVAGHAYAWPSLKIDALELIKVSDEGTITFFIDRLVLVSARGPIVLDSALMRNGRVLVDNAYRRLR